MASSDAGCKEVRTPSPRQCVGFADTIIDRWGRALSYQSAVVGGNLTALVVQLDDARLVGKLLARVAAGDPSVELVAPLARTFDAHGWDTFRGSLTVVIEGKAGETVGRNVRLLDRLCTSGERLTVCRGLTETAVAAIERLDREVVAINWRLRDVNRAQLLTGLSRALVATGQEELLSRFVTRVLADPKTYPLSAHVAALTSLGPWLKTNLKKPCVPVSRWLARCCEQLDELTATEPVAPATSAVRQTFGAIARTARNSRRSSRIRSNEFTGSAFDRTAASTSNIRSRGTGATRSARPNEPAHPRRSSARRTRLRTRRG